MDELASYTPPTTASTASAPTLSGYKLGAVLGSGSFGEVRIGVEKSSGRKVAIKIINKRGIQHVNDAERVSREFFILTALDHRHVIRLYEVCQDEQHLYLVMEYAGAGTLDSILPHDGGKMSENDARYLFNQVVSAVKYCHRQHVVHRDLKPENILLAKASSSSTAASAFSNVEVKVADFGLSNSTTHGVRARSPVGTPLYSAPEILFPALFPSLMEGGVEGRGEEETYPSYAHPSSANSLINCYSGEEAGEEHTAPSIAPTASSVAAGSNNSNSRSRANSAGKRGSGVAASTTYVWRGPDDEPVLDASGRVITSKSSAEYSATMSDIWSMGVILYRMLVGKLPFEADSMKDLKKKMFQPLDLPRKLGLSRQAVDLIRKLLQLDPFKRPAADDIGTHPWMLIGSTLDTLFGPHGGDADVSSRPDTSATTSSSKSFLPPRSASSRSDRQLASAGARATPPTTVTPSTSPSEVSEPSIAPSPKLDSGRSCDDAVDVGEPPAEDADSRLDSRERSSSVILGDLRQAKNANLNKDPRYRRSSYTGPSTTGGIALLDINAGPRSSQPLRAPLSHRTSIDMSALDSGAEIAPQQAPKLFTLSHRRGSSGSVASFTATGARAVPSSTLSINVPISLSAQIPNAPLSNSGARGPSPIIPTFWGASVGVCDLSSQDASTEVHAGHLTVPAADMSGPASIDILSPSSDGIPQFSSPPSTATHSSPRLALLPASISLTGGARAPAKFTRFPPPTAIALTGARIVSAQADHAGLHVSASPQSQSRPLSGTVTSPLRPIPAAQAGRTASNPESMPPVRRRTYADAGLDSVATSDDSPPIRASSSVGRFIPTAYDESPGHGDGQNGSPMSVPQHSHTHSVTAGSIATTVAHARMEIEHEKSPDSADVKKVLHSETARRRSSVSGGSLPPLLGAMGSYPSFFHVDAVGILEDPLTAAADAHSALLQPMRPALGSGSAVASHYRRVSKPS